MSTKRSVDRSTATQGNDGSAATQENDRLAVAHKVDRSAVKPKKDRSGLCCFAFADGRHCRTPRRSGHQHLCYFHAQKEAQARAAKEAGEAISSFFFSDYLSACDLSAALGRVFSAVAEGHLKPKVATALAYLGQTPNQSVQLAQHEYANVLGGDVWRRRVAACLEPPPPRAPQPVSNPVPTPHKPACCHQSSPQPDSPSATGLAPSSSPRPDPSS
jgi:hypothetical protein